MILTMIQKLSGYPNKTGAILRLSGYKGHQEYWCYREESGDTSTLYWNIDEDPPSLAIIEAIVEGQQPLYKGEFAGLTLKEAEAALMQRIRRG